VLEDPEQTPDEIEHPNTHIAALFDGALQFAREMLDAWDAGQRRYVAMRSAWVQVVLGDLAERVGWGTGIVGRQIAAILAYLSQRLGSDSTSRAGLEVFVSDLGVVYGLWSMIGGHRGARSQAA
jgi:hypothetical protein